MAELMYLPEVASAPPANVRVKFWDTTNWDPLDSRTDNGVHVVRDGSRSGVYLADGTQLVLLRTLPAEQAASFGNLVLRSLVTNGFVDGLYLPDELRSGTRRELQPGRCLTFNGTSQSVSTTNNIGTGKNHVVAETWLYMPAASASYKGIFELAGVTSDKKQQFYIVFNDRTLKTTLYNAAGGFSESFTPVLSVGWHHIVWKVDKTLTVTTCTSVWVDGVKQTLTGVTGTGTLESFANYPWTFGALNAGASHFSDAKMSAPRIIHPAAAWSDAACAQLYAERANPQHYVDTFCWLKLDDTNSYSAKDSSGNNNHGTISNFTGGMRYQGTDVPCSFQNQVGFTPSAPQPRLPSPTWESAAYGKTRFAGKVAIRSFLHEPVANFQEWYHGFNSDATDGNFPGYSYVAPTYGWNVAYNGNVAVRDAGTTPLIEAWTIGDELKVERGNDNYIRWYRNGVLKHTTAAPVTATLRTCYTDYQSVSAGVHDWLFYVNDVLTYDDMYIWRSSAATTAGTIEPGRPLFPRNELSPTLDVDGNPLKFTGQCPILPKQKQSHCLTLNGSSQYATPGVGTWDTDGQQAMVIRARVKFTSLTNSPMIAAHTNGAGDKGWYFLWNNGGGGYWRFRLMNSAGNQLAVYFGINDIPPLDKWMELELNYDGSRTLAGISLKIDGVLKSKSADASTLTLSASDPALPSEIGRASWNNNYLNGSLADVNITIGKKWWRYKCNEGLPSGLLLDSGPFANHCTLGNYTDSMWNTKQDVVHLNLTEGFRRGANVVKHSEQFDNAYWSKWNAILTANQSTAPDGTNTADLLSNNAIGMDYHWLGRAVSYVTGQTLTWSAYVKAHTGSGWAVLCLTGDGANHFAYFDAVNGTLGSRVAWDSHTITAVGSGWYRITATKLLATNISNVYIMLPNADGGVVWNSTGLVNTQRLLIWGAQLELGSSATPYHKTADIPGTCYTPRRDAVNLLRYSEQFGNTSAWSGVSAASVVSNAAVAPDGTLTADKLVEDNTLAYHYVLHSDLDLIAGSYAVMSCYAKQAEKSHVMLTLRDRAGSYWQKSFNIATGSIDPGFSSLTTTIESVGNGWYRCSILVPVGTGANTSRVRIYLVNDAANDANYTGNGTSGVYIWGAQVEYGTVPTPYAKTEDMPGPPGYKLSLLDASGLPITHPAGEWHNFAETQIDFTAGQSLAPEFAGSSPPTAYAAGTTVSGLSKQSLTNKERKYELVKV